MTLQQQPTRTSCGPTSVAMILGVPVQDVLTEVARVRRRKVRSGNHRTNLGELSRLLAAHGFEVGRRIRHEEPPSAGTFLLRIDHERGRGWHWSVYHNGVVFDPCRFDTGELGDYRTPISWYEVYSK